MPPGEWEALPAASGQKRMVQKARVVSPGGQPGQLSAGNLPDTRPALAGHASSCPQPENWTSFGSVTQITSETRSQATE